jgi:tetratricopeptide (TPR) repeat protein
VSSSVPRAIPLDDVRADGWFERLGEGSAAFAQLNGIVGARFVAFAVVAGLRITALAVDQRNADASSIEFGTEGGPSQRMALGEFKKRLAAALLGEDEPVAPLSAGATPEQIQAAIGFRYVLLAPIFRIRLDSIRVPAKGEAILTTSRASGVKDMTITELRELVRQGIRDEAARSTQARSPFSIDLEAVRLAKAAALAGENERVVSLLGTWPGPLSMLLRTMEGQSLTKEVRATIAEGLGLLGSAYAGLDRGDWAHEILRLAIQWGQDGAVTADLFRRLGATHLVQERHGEAIGMLRRALALGGEEKEILPLLAAAYAGRERRIAALLTIERAIGVGADEAGLSELRKSLAAALGEPWTRFQAYVHG